MNPLKAAGCMSGVQVVRTVLGLILILATYKLLLQDSSHFDMRECILL